MYVLHPLINGIICYYRWISNWVASFYVIILLSVAFNLRKSHLKKIRFMHICFPSFNHPSTKDSHHFCSYKIWHIHTISCLYWVWNYPSWDRFRMSNIQSCDGNRAKRKGFLVKEEELVVVGDLRWRRWGREGEARVSVGCRGEIVKATFNLNH